MSLKQTVFAIFPVIFDEYWFITSYIVLIFLLPFINPVVQKCSKKQFEIYIGIIIIVADIMPYIQNTNAPLGGIFSVGAMMAPYLIAAYIKKYNFKLSSIKAFIIVAIGALLEYISVFIMSKRNDPGRFTGGILPLIVAVGIFLLFINMRSFHSKIVNWLASGVLATYLITEHPIFRLVFWHQVLNVARFQNPTWLFILMGIVIAFATVIVCSVIDHLYQWGYKKVNVALHKK